MRYILLFQILEITTINFNDSSNIYPSLWKHIFTYQVSQQQNNQTMYSRIQFFKCRYFWRLHSVHYQPFKYIYPYNLVQIYVTHDKTDEQSDLINGCGTLKIEFSLNLKRDCVILLEDCECRNLKHHVSQFEIIKLRLRSIDQNKVERFLRNFNSNLYTVSL